MPIRINTDLPEDVTRDENSVVDITADNAIKVKNAVNNHLAYSYTVPTVRKVFETTRHASPDNLLEFEIILRLMIIDQIDGTNLQNGFGTGCFLLMARSIQEANLERLIANGNPIPNRVFESIAKRVSVTDSSKTSIFFSVVSKYIARTAQYVYGIEYGYPIYDEVLRNHLHLYIPSLTPTRISSLKNNCDYETYCNEINDYITNLNDGKQSNELVTNLMFDQIVWFSYKAKNADQKYL